MEEESTLPEDIAKEVARGNYSPLREWLDGPEGDVDARDAKGRTVLMLAVAVGCANAASNHPRTRSKPLDATRSLSLTDLCVFPLDLFFPAGCLIRRHRGIVSELIERGASLEPAQRQGTTALMFACYGGDVIMAKTLLLAKARLDAADNRGLTALDYAQLKDHTAITLLLRHHAAMAQGAAEPRPQSPTNETPESPAAERRGQPVGAAASSSANTSANSSGISSPMLGGRIGSVPPTMACSGLPPACALAESASAASSSSASTVPSAHSSRRPTLSSGDYSPAGAGVRLDSQGSSSSGAPSPASSNHQIPHMLPQQPLSAASTSTSTSTASPHVTLPSNLLEAAQNNEVDAVRAYLEEGGGHVDAADKQLGGTMLMCASSAGNLAIMDMLLNHGASVDVCDANGCTALGAACFALEEHAVQRLLDAGASVDIADNVGLTPLMLASLAGRLSLVRTLLSYGARKEARDANQHTALMYAQAKGHSAVAMVLTRPRLTPEARKGPRLTPEQYEERTRAADAAAAALMRSTQDDAAIGRGEWATRPRPPCPTQHGYGPGSSSRSQSGSMRRKKSRTHTSPAALSAPRHHHHSSPGQGSTSAENSLTRQAEQHLNISTPGSTPQHTSAAAAEAASGEGMGDAEEEEAGAPAAMELEEHGSMMNALAPSGALASSSSSSAAPAFAAPAPSAAFSNPHGSSSLDGGIANACAMLDVSDYGAAPSLPPAPAPALPPPPQPQPQLQPQLNAPAMAAMAAMPPPTGEVHIPDAFFCPIRQLLMADPVVTCDGHTYEREAIAAWLARKDTSPLTGAPLAHKNLVTNGMARSMIREFAERNPTLAECAELNRRVEMERELNDRRRWSSAPI